MFMSNYLFICSQNRLRSPTAENIFSNYKEIKTLSAGIDKDAESIVSAEDISWADIIFAMEKRHKFVLQNRFRELLSNKKIVVLNIPDRFEFMDPNLISILKKKMKPYL